MQQKTAAAACLPETMDAPKWAGDCGGHGAGSTAAFCKGAARQWRVFDAFVCGADAGECGGYEKRMAHETGAKSTQENVCVSII